MGPFHPEKMMAWLYLGFAAIFEIIFAMSMKYSEGFSKLLPTVFTVVGGIGAIAFLTLALKTLPISVAYPIWTAAGTLGTVLLGFLLLGESLGTLKVVSVFLIIAGIAGLKIAAG